MQKHKPTRPDRTPKTPVFAEWDWPTEMPRMKAAIRAAAQAEVEAMRAAGRG